MPLLAVHNGVTDLAALAEGLDLTAAGDNAFVRAVRRARQETASQPAPQSLGEAAGFDSRLSGSEAVIAKFDNRA